MNLEKSLHLVVTALTHAGLHREHNEDTFAAGFWVRNEAMTEPAQVRLSLETPRVCVVADGMGGHAAGEVASFYTACRLAQLSAGLTAAAAVVSALQAISDEISQQMKDDPGRRGMGTTVAGLVCHGRAAVCFNVGDSRVYQVKTGFLRQLSVDHVLQAPEDGVFDPAAREEAAPRSSGILQSLGGQEEQVRIAPSTVEVPLAPGTVFLICSDGVTDMLTEEDLEDRLRGDDTDVVKDICEAVLAAGAHDNLTIILVRVAGGLARE